MDAPKRRVSFSSLLATMVLGTVLVLSATLLFFMYRESGSAAIASSKTLFDAITTKTLSRIDTILQSLSTLTDTAVLAFPGDKDHLSGAEGATQLRSLKILLEDNSQLLSVYLGRTDGSFHQLIAVRGNRFIVEAYKAPATTAYVDRVITRSADGGRRQVWRFLDAALTEIASRTDTATDYDPRSRPWYSQALRSPRSVFSAPYVFSSSRLPGLTCARRLPGGGGVFGADITLAQLGDILAAQRVTRGGSLWIVDRDNRLVAFPGQSWEGSRDTDLRLPEARNAVSPLIRAVALETGRESGRDALRSFFLEVEGRRYMAGVRAMTGGHGPGLAVVVAAPLDDIIGHINRLSERMAGLTAVVLVLLVPLVVLVSGGMARSLKGLVREAHKITHFDFSPSQPITSPIREIGQLAAACTAMKESLEAKTLSLTRARERLEQLVQSGLALAGEKDLVTLVSLIFDTARALTQADGGVLYLMDNEELSVEMLSVGSGSIVLGGLSEHPAPRVMVRPGIMAFLSQESVLRFACEAFSKQEPVIAEGNLTLFPTGLPDEPRDYAIKRQVAVPIVTRRGQPLGVIQLFNPAEGKAADLGGGVADFVGSLAAQAAVTLDNRNLVNSLREVFDALIKVIAASIDAKSPYTAGHCTRVPELTAMLAQAAHEATVGPLRDFHMETDDDWRQLWIAAWLHDCGKVTTPEFVVDKATKLETIYNRIHEVRTRFEVLRRDAEIDYYKGLLAGHDDEAVLREVFERQCRTLEDDFAFVATCNSGGEFLSDEARERLARIGARSWLRHFSDRLGLSSDELRAKGDTPGPSLPAREILLADKPEHRIPRRRTYDHLKDAQGHAIEAPACEYNKGELYNLGIARGTLTSEERFKIQEHTLCGLDMLHKIPFPESLSRVTEIASAHHETLVGTGYPLKKSKEQLPVEARILAIADIFEALTAADRPYKPPKHVSEALRIMSFMRNDQHIDADLFDLFLREGVFRRYAARFLRPEQDDVEDVTAYLGKTSS